MAIATSTILIPCHVVKLYSSFDYRAPVYLHTEKDGCPIIKWAAKTWRHDRESGWSLQWRHNGHDSVSNHQPHDCFLNLLFRRRSKKTSKLRVIGLCAGNSPVPAEFPAQMASNAENLLMTSSWKHSNGRQGDMTYYITLYNARASATCPVESRDIAPPFWRNTEEYHPVLKLVHISSLSIAVSLLAGHKIP